MEVSGGLTTILQRLRLLRLLKDMFLVEDHHWQHARNHAFGYHADVWLGLDFQ